MYVTYVLIRGILKDYLSISIISPDVRKLSKAETRIRIRLSIRVRIPELLQARTYAIPYVKEPAGQRDVYGQSGCCPVRFRNMYVRYRACGAVSTRII